MLSEYLFPLAYQSGNISFSDWVTLFTLCLTPLVVHVIAGTPSVVYISSTNKKIDWHHRISQYNPTTILWRYFAIADRRVRAKSWNANDMAASNALFWTSHGWDGSESMIALTSTYLIKPPPHSRVSIFSKSFVKTVVITFQGVQATYALVVGFTKSAAAVDIADIALDRLFFPLAVLGLIRLFAAAWVTEDYYYDEHEDRLARSSTPIELVPSTSQKDHPFEQTTAYIPLETRTISSVGLIDRSPSSRFHPENSWRGILFKVVFLIPIIGLVVMCLLYMIPFGTTPGTNYLVPTILVVNIFYLVFLGSTLLIYIYYFVRGKAATTVIPCIVSTWYQIYTGLLFGMTILMITIACIETRKTTCGTYTTWPTSYTYNDVWSCGGAALDWSGNLTGAAYGIATRYANRVNETLLPEDQYRIFQWEGWCVGTEGADQFVKDVNGTG